MNLCLDIGNTSVKAAIFNNQEMTDFQRSSDYSLEWLEKFTESKGISKTIVCSTVELNQAQKQRISEISDDVTFLSHTTPVPIKNLYSTPETLGMDRLAAVVGAYSMHPGHNILVIDEGTAITYDMINDKGEYLGGNISPGMEMRLKALNKFTSKLPLVYAQGEVMDIGNNTHNAIRAGVINGIKYEIEGYVRHLLEKYKLLFVFLTGGNNINFEDSTNYCIFAEKFLVLKGLNYILNFIPKINDSKQDD